MFLAPRWRYFQPNRLAFCPLPHDVASPCHWGRLPSHRCVRCCRHSGARVDLQPFRLRGPDATRECCFRGFALLAMACPATDADVVSSVTVPDTPQHYAERDPG